VLTNHVNQSQRANHSLSRHVLCTVARQGAWHGAKLQWATFDSRWRPKICPWPQFAALVANFGLPTFQITEDRFGMEISQFLATFCQRLAPRLRENLAILHLCSSSSSSSSSKHDRIYGSVVVTQPCESSPGSRDECGIAPGGRRPLDTRSIDLSLWRRSVRIGQSIVSTFTTACIYCNSSLKAGTYFTVPRRVEGWVDLGGHSIPLRWTQMEELIGQILWISTFCNNDHIFPSLFMLIVEYKY